MNEADQEKKDYISTCVATRNIRLKLYQMLDYRKMNQSYFSLGS